MVAPSIGYCKQTSAARGARIESAMKRLVVVLVFLAGCSKAPPSQSVEPVTAAPAPPKAAATQTVASASASASAAPPALPVEPAKPKKMMEGDGVKTPE